MVGRTTEKPLPKSGRRMESQSLDEDGFWEGQIGRG
jgi:hypothetical protein